MLNKAVVLAASSSLFISSLMYAGSDYYGKIGVSYVTDKTVEEVAGETRNYNFDKGIGFQLAVGYDFEIMSMEAEYTYSTVNLTSVEFPGEGLSVAVGGYQDIYSVMVNALYHPIMEEKFSPYIGLGIGYSFLVWESANVGVNSSSSALTTQVMIGGSYEIHEDIELNLEVRHKMLENYTLSGVGEVEADSYNELFFALIYRFTP